MTEKIRHSYRFKLSFPKGKFQFQGDIATNSESLFLMERMSKDLYL